MNQPNRNSGFGRILVFGGLVVKAGGLIGPDDAGQLGYIHNTNLYACRRRTFEAGL